jgi:hypothetical protein
MPSKDGPFLQTIAFRESRGKVQEGGTSVLRNSPIAILPGRMLTRCRLVVIYLGTNPKLDVDESVMAGSN